MWAPEVNHDGHTLGTIHLAFLSQGRGRPLLATLQPGVSTEEGDDLIRAIRAIAKQVC